MKKDRNTFFQESGFYNQSMMPNQMSANQPFIMNAQSGQSFYSNFPNNMNYQVPSPNYNNYDTSDIEARLNKIERNINRLDARVSKLESQTLYTTDDIDVSTNMYMV